VAAVARGHRRHSAADRNLALRSVQGAPRLAALAGAACLVALAGLSLAVPEEPWEPFQGVNHISNFVRSGVTDALELFSHGWLEADAAAPGHST